MLEKPKATIDTFLKSNHGAHKINLEIEFVAHGHPHRHKKLLILPKGKSANEPMIEISPDIIARFFNQYASNQSGYCFSSLTLYCCSSVPFGRELSELMPSVNITCFNDDIFVDSNGNVYAKGGTEQSTPRVFSSGIENTISIESNPIITKSGVSTSHEADTPTLVAPNSIIRGNPFPSPNKGLVRSKSVDSYLSQERNSSISSEPTDNANPRRSVPTTRRRR
jgi:hypothetical protein